MHYDHELMFVCKVISSGCFCFVYFEPEIGSVGLPHKKCLLSEELSNDAPTVNNFQCPATFFYNCICK